MLRHADVIRYNIRAEMRAEMDRAYFGLIWWVAEPILYMAVFYVMFEVVFARGGPDFVPFLLVGLVAWRWFDASVRTSASSIEKGAALINQVHIPKLVFPLVIVFSNTIKFFIILAILILFLLLYGFPPTVTWIALPLLIAVQFVLVTTFSSLVALVVPFFPDLTILIGNIMTMLMFMSGVFFSISNLEPTVQAWLYLNPMAILIESYREILINGRWPDWSMLGTILAACVPLLVLALWMARRFDRTYPKLVL